MTRVSNDVEISGQFVAAGTKVTIGIGNMVAIIVSDGRIIHARHEDMAGVIVEGDEVDTYAQSNTQGVD